MNRWDAYVNYAVRFRWTPAEVDSMDPDFLDSLNARMMAEALNDWKPAGGGK